MKLLLDTHIWHWYLTGSKKLSSSVIELIDKNIEEIWLSPISIWEVLILAEKGKIELSTNPRNWVEESFKKFSCHMASLSSEIVVRSRELKYSSQDPADRFIAATSLVYEIPLVTMDKMLRKQKWLTTYPTTL